MKSESRLIKYLLSKLSSNVSPVKVEDMTVKLRVGKSEQSIVEHWHVTTSFSTSHGLPFFFAIESKF